MPVRSFSSPAGWCSVSIQVHTRTGIDDFIDTKLAFDAFRQRIKIIPSP